MRMILAATLVEDDGVFGHVEGAAAEPVFHVDENVGEIAACDYYGLGFVRAFAGWILAHVDLRRLGGGAIELYRAVYRGRGCGIDGSGGRGWRPWLRHGGGWLFRFPVTSFRQQESPQTDAA